MDLLSELVANLVARDGWQPRRLHLFGFSQGGTAALQAVASRGWVRVEARVRVGAAGGALGLRLGQLGGAS